MEAAKMPGAEKADQQSADSADSNIKRRFHVEITYSEDKNVTHHGIEDAPAYVHRGRGKSLACRLRKRGLERVAHCSADKVWNGVGEKQASEKVGEKMEPIHFEMLLVTKVDECECILIF